MTYFLFQISTVLRFGALYNQSVIEQDLNAILMAQSTDIGVGKRLHSNLEAEHIRFLCIQPYF